MGSKKKEYATSEVAKMLGINKRTLYRWLYNKHLPEPRQLIVGRTKIRIWTDQDVKRAVELKQQMSRGRPSADKEIKVEDRRLLAFQAQLKWYSRIAELTDKERNALGVLQEGLHSKLVERGLEW